MPLIKSKSKAAFKKNVETLTGEVGKSPHVQSQKQAIAIAFSIKRRGRAEGGAVEHDPLSGVPITPDYDRTEPEAAPNVAVRNAIATAGKTLGTAGYLGGNLAKRVLWDVPHEAMDAAKTIPYGVRREDYTDVPQETPGSHLDPLISPSLETGLNVMGGTAFSAPARGADEVLGAGPSIRAAADKRTVGSPALNEVDQILNAERNLKGAAREPGSAATVPEGPAAAGAAPEVGPGGGGAAGTRGLDEAQAAAARWAGERKPLEGIPGVTYKDYSSSAAARDRGAKNFVVFDTSILRLLKKYGILGPAALGAAAAGDEEERASGGAVDSAMSIARSLKRASGGKVHVGPIMGDTGGRADKVPMKVPNGSYVCTADHVSGLGEGNTMAGMKKLGSMFPKSKPSLMRKLPHDDLVPIYAADGEFVVSPEDIMDRYGDLDEGHRILDHWQTTSRKNLIKELATLAPPAQD